MNHGVFEKYRIKSKISKQDLAKKVGKTAGWYSKLASGKMNLRPQHIATMANAFGIKPEKLAKEYFSDVELEETSTLSETA